MAGALILGAARYSLMKLKGRQHRKMAEGTIDSMVCSKNSVKSKLPSQLAGPNACRLQFDVASDNHVAFDMIARVTTGVATAHVENIILWTHLLIAIPIWQVPDKNIHFRGTNSEGSSPVSLSKTDDEAQLEIRASA